MSGRGGRHDLAHFFQTEEKSPTRLRPVTRRYIDCAATAVHATEAVASGTQELTKRSAWILKLAELVSQCSALSFNSPTEQPPSATQGDKV